MGAEAGGDPEAAHVRRPQDELAVRREGLGPVDEANDLHVAERRNPHEGVLHQLLEAGPVLLEQPPVEVGRDAVEAPRGRVALVAAHHEAARLAAEVDEERGVAHGRHVERHPGRPRDQVHVGHRHDRDDDSGEGSDLAREHAARVHDEVGLDLALVGLDGSDAVPLDADPRDARARRDLRAAAARALREREGELARVDVAVRREVGGAEDTLGRHWRKERLRLGGRDQVEVEAERLRPAGLARELLHPLLRGGEPQRADLAPAGLEPDLLAELAVEVDRAHHHLREAQRAAKLPHQARGVEGRAAGQVGALDEHDIAPAEPRQPVEDRAAADAAADDDGVGSLPQRCYGVVGAAGASSAAATASPSGA